ncbi:LIM-domain binding protein-domain-containing protein [Lactifluus subvellereus]|nr:LIM-domain binding protein-domain-containing protein [Lactifluus subvellereus]
MSTLHLSEGFTASTLDPARPQSQLQRPSSNQLTGSSLTPNTPPGTLPANATLFQGHPGSIGGGSCPPPQPYPSFCKAIGDDQLPLTPASSTENGDSSRQPGAPGIPPYVPRFVYIQVLVVFALLTTLWLCSHPPAIGHGQALMRVLQLSSMLAAEDQKSHKLRLSHWVSLVEEFFLTSATLKLILWKDNQKVEAKIFEVGRPVLPRFFLVTSQSGVKSMTLSLDGARERIVGPNRAIVQCVFAMWTYRYYNGYTVTLRGPFLADVFLVPDATQNGAHAQSAPHPTFKLMIDRIHFDSLLYEKRVSVDAIDAPTPPPTVDGAGVLPFPPPQLPPPQADQVDPVNAFGIPQATMRCLEVRLLNLSLPGTNLKDPYGLVSWRRVSYR